MQAEPATANTIDFVYADNQQDKPAPSAGPNYGADRSGDEPLLYSQNYDYGSDDGDAVSAHYIAVSLYNAINDLNGDVAGNLLNSYRILGRIGDEIISAIKAPLSALGLGADPFAQVQLDGGVVAVADNGGHDDDTLRRSDINRIIALAQLFFSIDYLPYYILALIAYALFALVRAWHGMRNEVRSEPLHAAGSRSERDRDAAA